MYVLVECGICGLLTKCLIIKMAVKHEIHEKDIEEGIYFTISDRRQDT